MSKRDLSAQARAIMLLLAEFGSLWQFDLIDRVINALPGIAEWRVKKTISNLLANGLLKTLDDGSGYPAIHSLSLTEEGKARIAPYTHA